MRVSLCSSPMNFDTSKYTSRRIRRACSNRPSARYVFARLLCATRMLSSRQRHGLAPYYRVGLAPRRRGSARDERPRRGRPALRDECGGRGRGAGLGGPRRPHRHSPHHRPRLAACRVVDHRDEGITAISTAPRPFRPGRGGRKIRARQWPRPVTSTPSIFTLLL